MARYVQTVQKYPMMNPQKAWTPLPKNKWTRDTARHLASRIGFSVHPKIIDEFYAIGPLGVVNKYLLAPKQMEQLPSLISMDDSVSDYRQMGEKDRREARQEMQKLNREGYAEYAVAWNQFAREPQNAPQEKLCSFFQNVWVVAFQGVKRTPALFEYQNKIRESLTSTYPALCYRLTLTQAMGNYLNLNQNKDGAPNENFARELFELFTLGEGNYTEADIKETARALTGYTFRPDGTVVLREKAHDSGSKTVFGKKGRFKLEDILELVFQQPAASNYLPSEFLRFYLSDSNIDPSLIQELGDLWRKKSFNLPFLYATVFNSREFYEPQYRGNMIKSPAHYYIGLHQDFEIDVLPLPRECVRVGRLMGQAFFNPPNVKGWDGGRSWINSATLSARRQVAETLLQELNTNRLNADEERALQKAKAQNPDANYRIDVAKLYTDADSPEKLSSYLSENLFAQKEPTLLLELARSFFEEEGKFTRSSKQAITLAAINSPAYQLC